MTYGGLPTERLEVDAVARAGARPRPGAGRGRHRARRPPDLHGDARAARDPRRRAAPCGRTGRAAADEDQRRPPLPRLPQHLRRSREHRRPHAARGASRPRARRARGRHRRRARSERARPPLRRRRPGSRAGARSRPTSPRRAMRFAPRTRAASRCSPSAAGISSSVAATAAATARSCPAPGSSRTRPSRATTRMIGDVLLECELEPGEKRQLAGFENHAGRTILDAGAAPLGRVVHGFGNDGASGFEGCRLGRRDRDVPPRAAASAEPVARRLAARAGARARDGRRAARARATPRRARGGGVPRRGGAGSEARRTPLRARFSRGTPSHHPLSSVTRKASRVVHGTVPRRVPIDRSSRHPHLAEVDRRIARAASAAGSAGSADGA